MALRYALTENLLTSDPNDYMAVTTDNPTVGINEIVERMINRGSTVTKAEALGVIEEFNQAVADLLKTGVNINTELFTVYPSISGVFNASSEAFNPNKHSVNLRMRVGNRLKDVSKSIALERVPATANKPYIQLVTDLVSGVVNDTISIGQIVSVKGSLLKIADGTEGAGLFIIGDGKAEVQVTQIVKNKPSELLFFVPVAVTSGPCAIEVRTVTHSSKALKVTRTSFELTAVSV